MTHDTLAADYQSVRRTDKDGHLHIARMNISKAAVNDYYGREIAGGDSLGLEPDRLYKLWRHPDELEKAADSFNGKPLLTKHRPQVSSDHDEDIVAGSVSNVQWAAPYLVAEGSVWTDDAIAGIESGAQRELSSSYRYRADMTPGVTPEGEAYDGIMRDIVGNHVALVERGRAGPECFVGDSQPKEHRMKRKQLLASIADAQQLAADELRKKLAADAALAPAVAKLDKLAKDAKAKADACPDDDEDMNLDDEPDDDEEKKKAARDKRAKDAERPADMREGETEEEYKARKKREEDRASDAQRAMDQQTIDNRVAEGIRAERRRLDDIRDAERFVRPFAGEISFAADSAEEVYRFALTAAGVDHKEVPKGTPNVVFRTLLTAAGGRHAGGSGGVRLAADSVGNTAVESFAKRFPTATPVTVKG